MVKKFEKVFIDKDTNFIMCNIERNMVSERFELKYHYQF